MCICQKRVVSAGTRSCEESVECKVASMNTLKSKQVSLWIFNSSGQFNFAKFFLRDDFFLFS